MGKGLDVLNQCWCSMDSTLEDPGRRESGQRRAALDSAGQGRLLSGQEPGWGADQIDREGIDTSRCPISEHRLKSLPQPGLAMDVKVDLPGADRLGRELESVQDQMRG